MEDYLDLDAPIVAIWCFLAFFQWCCGNIEHDTSQEVK